MATILYTGSASRILLQQAQHDWRQQFGQHFRSQRDSGVADRAFARAPATKSAAAEIDPKLVAEKAAGPVFSCEVQIVVIYQSRPAEKRRAKVALDRVTESAVELLGGGKIWKRTATENVSGARIFKGRTYPSALLPWSVMECLAPAGYSRYALSPREVAPLWPTSSSHAQTGAGRDGADSGRGVGTKARLAPGEGISCGDGKRRRRERTCCSRAPAGRGAGRDDSHPGPSPPRPRPPTRDGLPVIAPSHPTLSLFGG